MPVNTVSSRIISSYAPGARAHRYKVEFDTFMTSVRFPTQVYTANGVRVGWVAGGGLEYPLWDLEHPLWDGVSLRIEGLYHDFGSNTYKQPRDEQFN